MLEIVVNLVPFGQWGKSTQIARMTIANTGDHPKRPDYGNYRAQIAGSPEVVIKNHRREDGPWPLIRKAIEKSLKARSK